MRLLYLNPNSTASMTDGIVAVARSAAPDAEVVGWTNDGAPPAIQGAEDGEAAVPGLLSMLPAARKAGADAIVIACFDDTGLAQVRAEAHCPVIGIGQSAYHVAALLGRPFVVLTTLDVSVPVIAANVAASGVGDACLGVRASGIPVLDVDAGSDEVIGRLADHVLAAGRDGAGSVVLGCAGMAPHLDRIARPGAPLLVDGVRASARLAGLLASLA